MMKTIFIVNMFEIFTNRNKILWYANICSYKNIYFEVKVVGKRQFVCGMKRNHDSYISCFVDIKGDLPRPKIAQNYMI